MKVLVTGGTGYIGELLIPCLLEKSYTVRVLCRDVDKARKLFGDTCEYWRGDVTNPDSIEGCCEGFDVVYHMAAISGNDLPSSKAFSLYRNVNVGGTQNILEESKKAGIKRFIFLSSIAAMGIVTKFPITENSECNPVLPYQVSKYEAEQLVNTCIQDGFPAIILRPTKIYGEGEHEHSFLTLAKLCNKGIILKIGRGRNLISYTYISDFIRAMIGLIDKGTIGETYILSSDDSVAFIEAERVISSTIGKNTLIVRVPVRAMEITASILERACALFHIKPFVTKKNIEAITTDRIYDITKIKEETGFSPQVDMVTGIKTVTKWYLDNSLI